MRFLCLLLTCFCLCGCFLESSQRLPEEPPATVQMRVEAPASPTVIQTPKTVDLRDRQTPTKFGWPVTIVICSLFLFMPLLAGRRRN